MPYDTNKTYDHNLIQKPLRLVILLGSKCQLHCDYCFQQNSSNHIPVDNFTPSKIEDFMKSLRKFDLSNISHVTLWGGEPLLYFKTIKQLVPRIRQEYPHFKNFFISTNGLLLNQETLEWLYENGIGMQISDDGKNQDRGLKAIQEFPRIRSFVKSFLETHPDMHVKINAVISKNNLDLYQFTKWAMQAYGENIKISFNVLHTPVEDKDITNNSLYRFTDKQLQLVFTSTFKTFTELTPSVRSRYDVYLHRLLKLGNIDTVCLSGRNAQLNVDVNGDTYVCNEFPFKQTRKFIKTNDRIKCNDCLVKNLCGGSCPLISDKNVYCLCDLSFAFYYGIFCAIVHNTTGLDVYDIGVSNDLISRLGNKNDYDKAILNNRHSVINIQRL